MVLPQEWKRTAARAQCSLPEFALRGTWQISFDLNRGQPAAHRKIPTDGATLHRKSPLIVRRNAGIETGVEQFRRLPSLAKKVVGFCLWKDCFFAIF
jgi:hypothetical protein